MFWVLALASPGALGSPSIKHFMVVLDLVPDGGRIGDWPGGLV